VTRGAGQPAAADWRRARRPVRKQRADDVERRHRKPQRGGDRAERRDTVVDFERPARFQVLQHRWLERAAR
jgi:hypothetical protein